MEGVFQLLLRLGYPREGVEYLRRFRLPIIVFLAILAWLGAILIGIVALRLFSFLV
jgi:hypothetical protein